LSAKDLAAMELACGLRTVQFRERHFGLATSTVSHTMEGGVATIDIVQSESSAGRAIVVM
jgi:hypothetical protein